MSLSQNLALITLLSFTQFPIVLFEISQREANSSKVHSFNSYSEFFFFTYTILPISLPSFFTFLYLRFQQLSYPSLVHFTYLLFHILSYPLLIQFSYLPPFISSILPFHQLSYTLHSSNCSSFIFLIHIIYISHRSFIPPIFLS